MCFVKYTHRVDKNLQLIEFSNLVSRTNCIPSKFTFGHIYFSYVPQKEEISLSKFEKASYTHHSCLKINMLINT